MAPVRWVVVLALCCLGACQSPFLTLAGGSLQGQEAHTTNWRFAGDYQVLQLETRPTDPYSVNLRVTVIDDQLYIDAAEQRKWHAYLKEDPKVRVKLGARIYPAIAIVVNDEKVLRHFLAGRTVYRLDPLPQKLPQK